MATSKRKTQSQSSSKKIQNQFMQTFYSLIDSQNYSDLINWGEEGASFTIYKPNAFSQIVLPILCKHKNLSSFVRQLNMYNFKKCKLKSQADNETMTYYHPFFMKNKPELLKSIIRKNPRRILAEKRAHLQELGIDSALEKFSAMMDQKSLEQTSCNETKSSGKEKKEEIVQNMFQIIEAVSAKSDERTMSMIRNYLNDDEDDENNEDDCIEFSKPTKKVQKSRDSSFSTDDSAQELPTDAIPSDFFFFDSNKQTKIPWASVLPLLKEKDLISCRNLISNLFLSEKTKNEPLYCESDFSYSSNAQDLSMSRVTSSCDEYLKFGSEGY